MPMLNFIVGEMGVALDHEYDKEAIALCHEYNLGGFPMLTHRKGFSFYSEFVRNAEFFVKFHQLVSKYHPTGCILDGDGYDRTDEEFERERVHEEFRTGRRDALSLDVALLKIRDHYNRAHVTLPPAPPTICHVL